MSDEDKKGLLFFAVVFLGAALYLALTFNSSPSDDGRDPCMNQSGVPMYEMPPDC